MYTEAIMSSLVVIAHDMRSTHNVGSLFRTMDGLGVKKIYLTGYTAYPAINNDSRLPYIAAKLDTQIHKTALGAEKYVKWEHNSSLEETITQLKDNGYTMVALEQDTRSVSLEKYVPLQSKIALLLGTETTGLTKEQLALCDEIIEIPMLGTKESFNVVQAAAIAVYVLSQKL